MDQIRELLARMTAQTDLTYERLPDIDLYMDQVIEYLSRQCLSLRENDKISSALINNYIKDGLLPRAVDKTYTREHLAYLLMIARLKQTLSVKDVGLLLQSDAKGEDVASYFDRFQRLVAETADAVGASLPKEENELSAVAVRLAISGYVSRIVCEMILTRLEGLPTDGEPVKAESEKKDDPAPESGKKKKSAPQKS